MNIQPAHNQLKTRLDWKAYYKLFSETHGGFPIIYKGRQLFSDGWMYALQDYGGPEWPPPTDLKELCTLQSVYWYTRWNRARNELIVLRQQFDALKGLQETKNCQLQQIVTTIDDHEGKRKISQQSLDWTPEIYEMTLSFLESEVETADKKLKELKGSDPESTLTNGDSNGHVETELKREQGGQRHTDEPVDVARPDCPIPTPTTTGELGKPDVEKGTDKRGRRRPKKGH